MRKLYKLLMALIMVMGSSITSWALDFSEGDIAYHTQTWAGSGINIVEVTGLSATGKNKAAAGNFALIIPGHVTYSGTKYQVVGVESNSFAGQAGITSVYIYAGMRYVRSSAFKNCSDLATLYLPSTATLGNDAFANCSKLKTVKWAVMKQPENNTPFTNAGSGMTLTIPKVSSLSSTLKNMNGYKNFTISQDKSVCDFHNYGIYMIATDATATTYSPSSTHEMWISGGSQNAIDPDLTTASWSLSNLNWALTGVFANAFLGETAITSIDLQGCTKITTIGENAFNNCTALTTIKLPASVTSIDVARNTGDGCTALTSIEVASGNTTYSSYSGCLYNKAQTFLYRVPQGKSGSMSYPSTLLTVGSDSHDLCTKITQARLPHGVKTIQSYAFYKTSGLDYTYIPSSVTDLSNTYVFTGTKSNNYIYCNMQNPPTVTASSYFGTTSSMRLYVPYGKEQTYKDRGWTGFASYNNNGIQAHDTYQTIGGNNLAFTVSSTASTTVNGKSYNGRARLVCYGDVQDNSKTSITIPESVTINGKTYAVTKIGEYAFKSHTSNFTVSGCANVDTVGEGAFKEQAVTSYAFTHNLRYIEHYAFSGAGLTGTVALPYGVKSLGISSFANGKYSRFITPSSVSSVYGSIWYGTTSLTELVLNLSGSWAYNYTGWDLTSVPNTCNIRVPTGYVQHWKKNSKLSSRASYITAGAYDYAYSNSYTGLYFMTITSNSSTTHNGTTYAGTAKYVYHPNIQNSSSTSNYGFSIYEEDQTVSTDKRKYLITEIGDSCLYGSKFTGGGIPASVTRIGQSAFRACEYAVNNLTLPAGLTYVGHDAFYNSKIKGEVKIPESVTYLGEYAFCTSTLGALYFPKAKPATFEKNIWSQQNSSFVAWVPNEYANGYLTSANSWGTNYANKLAVWIKPEANHVTFGSVIPVNLQGSNINGYYASAFDKNNATQQVTLTKVNQAAENTGLLLTDLTPNQEYRIKRPTSTVAALPTNYLTACGASSTSINSPKFYWNSANKRFYKATSATTIPVGKAYLNLTGNEAGNLTEAYTNLWPKTNSGGITGDVNGNGVVDIADVNAAINVMLGKEPNSKYGGRADANGNGVVDIADVNAVINAMLGK